MRVLNGNIYPWISSISIWIACFMAIISIKPWFAWGLPFDTLLSILFIFFRLPLLHKRYSARKILLLEVFLVFSVFYLQFIQIPIKLSIIRAVVTIIPVGLFLLTTTEEKSLFLKRLIRIYSIILFVSIIGFTLKTLGLNLPYSLLQNPNPFYDSYKNYYIFTVYQDLELFTRFTSIFAEPGHVGMVSAILLYINGFSLKRKSNILMTISLIWSFSLAGFVIYAAGLILFLILRSRNPIKSFMTVVLCCGCIAGIAIMTYSPNNDDIVTQLILRRLEFDSAKGLAGNNRNTGNFENVYNNFIDGPKVLVGMGAEEYGRKFYGTANSSYKTFIMEYGIGATITLLIVISFSLVLYPSKIGLGLLCLILIAFLQRPYFTWFIECLPFFGALPLFYKARKTI